MPLKTEVITVAHDVAEDEVKKFFRNKKRRKVVEFIKYDFQNRQLFIDFRMGKSIKLENGGIISEIIKFPTLSNKEDIVSSLCYAACGKIKGTDCIFYFDCFDTIHKNDILAVKLTKRKYNKWWNFTCARCPRYNKSEFQRTCEIETYVSNWDASVAEWIYFYWD